MIKKLSLSIYLLLGTFSIIAQSINTDNYILKENVSYISNSEKDAYKLERCKLDIYYPTDKKNFATVIWFHGG